MSERSSDETDHSLPAWATLHGDGTGDPSIRCDICGASAPELPVDHEDGCIYNNDLVADGGSQETVEGDAQQETGAVRVMVDIETLGLERGAAILSIGAVEFIPGGLGDEFYREISLESCQDAGLHIDAGTLDWWLSQDDAVAGVLTGGDPLPDVLEAFNAWYPDDAAEVWSNSPSFDCEILEDAFDAVGLTEPWGFGDERDVRTLWSLPCAVDVEMDGNEHDALDDARRQARSVSETLGKIRRRGEVTADD
jgi:hypothetical protein